MRLSSLAFASAFLLVLSSEAYAVDLTCLAGLSNTAMTSSLHPDGSPRFLRGEWAAPVTPRVTSDPLGAAAAFIGNAP